MELKVAAILAAEVVGLEQLLQEREAATVSALQAHYHALIDRLIAMHRGRIVELRLDRTLVEFEIVIDAMECALGIQRGMAQRNADLRPEHRVMLRVGLDHRDVIADRGDITGHGVDVACFLRDLVEPGGLCISDRVYLAVRKRVKVDFEGRGVHRIGDVAEPVRAIGTVFRPDAGARQGWWPWRRS